MGASHTNNQAEYAGLIAGLKVGASVLSGLQVGASVLSGLLVGAEASLFPWCSHSGCRWVQKQVFFLPLSIRCCSSGSAALDACMHVPRIASCR